MYVVFIHTQETDIMVYFYMCYVFIQLTEHIQFIPQPVGGTWTPGTDIMVYVYMCYVFIQLIPQPVGGTWTQGTDIMAYVYMCYVFIQLTEHIQPVGGTWTQGTGRFRGHDTVTITCTFPAGIQNVSASFRFHIEF